MMFQTLLFLACAQQVLPPDQNEVDKAIQKGVMFLSGTMLPDTLSIHPGQPINYDALVLYTFTHAGVKRADFRFQELAVKVSRAPVERTYTAACTAMALGAVDAKTYREKIVLCAQYLVDMQCANGQWSYGEKYDTPAVKIPEDTGGTSVKTRVVRSGKFASEASGDNSNTQYAALGLYAVWRGGVEIERGVVDKALRWWEGTQLADGSWHYGAKGPWSVKGVGSMAAGGGSSIVMLRRMKGDTGKPSLAKNTVDWMGANFSVSENPAATPDRQKFHYYHLYAMERLGDLLPVEKMGRHLWYAEGANWLLSQQKKNGSWCGESGWEVADTCFAILFLQRATRVVSGVMEKK